MNIGTSPTHIFYQMLNGTRANKSKLNGKENKLFLNQMRASGMGRRARLCHVGHVAWDEQLSRPQKEIPVSTSQLFCVHYSFFV